MRSRLEPGELEQSAAVLKLGQARGYVTLDEIGQALAGVKYDLEAYVVRGDELFCQLSDTDVCVIDLENAEAPIGRDAPAAIERDDGRSPADLERVPIDDGVAMYFADIGRAPLLRRDEELALAMLIDEGRSASEALSRDGHSAEDAERLRSIVLEGEKARADLIRANTRLVISIAKKYQGLGLPLMDLVQAGNMGLIRAADKYDLRRGTKFSTLATWWVRQAVARSVAKDGRTIRLPIHMGAQLRRVRQAQQTLGQTLERDPTPEEIAGSIGTVSPERVRWMLRAALSPLSLEQPIGEDGDGELGQLIEDTTALSPSETTELELLREDLTKIMRDLPPREARAVRMRYGLDGRPPLALKEIGDRMGVTRERARQIVVQALRRLRHPRRRRDLSRYLR